MRVSQLDLHHFRNHTATSLNLDKGVSVFVGPNGQGKTNLIEAIGYLAYQSSHRVSIDRALVESDQPQAVVRAVVEHDGRSVEIACEINASGANRAKVNAATTPVSQLSGWLKAVLFTPEDLTLVRGEPSGRRRYLDQTMVVLRPSLHQIVSDYDRVIRQRNALLKSHRGRPTAALEETLSGWEEQLIDLSTGYTLARASLLSLLGTAVADSYRVIAPGNEVSLALESAQGVIPLDDESSLREWYREQFSRVSKDEWDRGMTLFGPHRDDLVIALNTLPARTHSSQGEAWSLALSLRMAQAVLYRAESPSGDPVMILDDVFAELDRSRRATLEQLVSNYEQVLVTAAVWEDIPEAFRERVFHVQSGQVVSGG